MENDKRLASNAGEGSGHAVRSTAAVRHTPGPWFWDGYYLRSKPLMDTAAAWSDYTIWDDGSSGGEYTGFDTDGPNGRLIAAAPELLDACMFVKGFLDKLEGGLDVDDPLTALRQKFHAPLHAKLDAAIAKAQSAIDERTASPKPSSAVEANPNESPKGN